MGQTTNIQWCDSTVNPASGCDGCELWNTAANRGSCYAGNMQVQRLSKCHPSLYSPRFADVKLLPGRMAKAAAWKPLNGVSRFEVYGKPGNNQKFGECKPWLDGQPRVIFIGDMTDIFGPGIPFEYVADQVIRAVISEPGRRHFWIMVTKRPERAAQFERWVFNEHRQDLADIRNLMLLVSVTSQRTFERITAAQKCNFAWFGASFEPLLGPVDFSKASPLHADEVGRGWRHDPVGAIQMGEGVVPPMVESPWWPPLDWAIIGGGSGSAGFTNTAWLANLARQTAAAGVPTFVKQVGSHPTLDYYHADDDLREWALDRRHQLVTRDGREWHGPDGRRINDGQPPPGTSIVYQPPGSHGQDWDQWPASLRVRQVPDFAAMMGGQP